MEPKGDYHSLKQVMSDAIREEDEGSNPEDVRERRHDNDHKERRGERLLERQVDHRAAGLIPTADISDQIEKMTRAHKAQIEQMTEEFQRTLKGLQSQNLFPRREAVWCPLCQGNHTGNECPTR